MGGSGATCEINLRGSQEQRLLMHPSTWDGLEEGGRPEVAARGCRDLGTLRSFSAAGLGVRLAGNEWVEETSGKTAWGSPGGTAEFRSLSAWGGLV